MVRRFLNVAAAILAILFVQVLSATPVSADVSLTKLEIRNIAFTYGGQPLMCQVRGRTDYIFNEFQDLSSVQVETLVSGDGPCGGAARSAAAIGNYRRPDDDSITFESSSPGPEIHADSAFTGPAVEVYSTHDVVFACDEDSHGCRVRFSTHTK